MAEVTADHEVKIDGTVEGPLEHASRHGEGVYISVTHTATADSDILSITNGEAAKDFHITRLLLNSAAQQTWRLFEVTGGTATGTAVTYLNPNLISGIQNTLTIRGNADVLGALSGDTILLFDTIADVGANLFLEGSVILGNGDHVALNVDTAGVVGVTVLGFFKPKENLA